MSSGTLEQRLAHALQLAATRPTQALTILKSIKPHHLNEHIGHWSTAERIRGIANNVLGHSDLAFQHFEHALSGFQQINDQNGVAAAYSGMGNVLFAKMNYEQSAKMHLMALRIREIEKDKRGLIGTYINLGNAYQRSANLKLAAKMFLQALSLSRRLQEYGLYAHCCLAYSNLLLDRKQYRRAEHHLKEIFRIHKGNLDDFTLATTSNNLGIVLTRTGRHKTGRKYLQTALEASKRAGLLDEEVRASINLSEALLAGNEIAAARRQLEAILPVTRKKRFRESHMIALRRLSDIFAAEGDHKQALRLFKNYYNLIHQHAREENVEALNRARARYELDRKQREKELFKLKNVDLKNALRKLDEEKKKADHLLRNILPDDVANDLKKNGKSDIRHYEEVTIVFADIKGFTSISERETPEMLVNELDYCFRQFDAIMEKYGLEKIKTIGDAYMCACGLPQPRRDHALRAVRASVDMMGFMQHRYRERSKLGQFAFELRIGINTGPVIAGIIGVKKFAYDIWGDSVNIAARMEQTSEAGQINISATTYNKIKRYYACQYRGEIEAKNRGKLKMYFLTKNLKKR
ncbi:MAG: adenylate/guanylate cyclase domain-containing protein [Chitinophagales bacterium]